MNTDTILVFNLTANLLSFGAGYYVAYRGFSGVKKDLEAMYQDVKHLKERIDPTPTATAPVVP